MLTGNDAALIVVDDPIGCVVPSEGVRIIGRDARISFMPKGGDRYVDLGDAVMLDIKMHELEIRRDFVLSPPAMGKTLAVNKFVRRRERKLSGIKGLR